MYSARFNWQNAFGHRKKEAPQNPLLKAIAKTENCHRNKTGIQFHYIEIIPVQAP
jgi:hypothetical protein